jgi:hypothetical protein
MHPEAEHAEMKRLLERNYELLKENNRLLKKLHRNAVWGMWIRVIGYALILGAPVALYFYVLEPYLMSMGSSVDSLRSMLEQIPNFEQFLRDQL